MRIAHSDAQPRIRLVAADFRSDEQFPIGRALQRERAQIRFRDDFQPHALPYAALRGVPDAFALDFLLAARLGAGIVGIVNAQRDLKSVVRVHEGGDIDVEWQIAADMRARILAVDETRADVIDRFEMQNKPVRVADLPDTRITAEGNGMHGGAVPQQIVGIYGLMHTGKRRFRGERN